MRIELNQIDVTQFMIHPHIFNGELLHLVQPQHIGCKWTQSNKHLRSSVWNSEGELVSAGFSKFTNFGENPDNFPVPNSLNGCVVTDKLDGSLLIISKYKGNFILRTRGTLDASKMENGHELEVFNQKYPKILEFQPIGDSWPFSILVEWTSPLNRVVIPYGDEPTFTLIGVVVHDNYSLWTQEWLDILAKEWGINRPETFKFTDITDLLEKVDQWKGREGVVIYSKGDQALHKCKSFDYLTKHRLKEEFGNIEKIVDFFINEGSPDYTTFSEKIAGVTDWETFNEVRGDCSRICDGWKEVLKIVAYMQEFVEPLKKLPRKDAALKILSSYGETNRASFCFAILDGKSLSKEQLKKLLWQCIKDK